MNRRLGVAFGLVFYTSIAWSQDSTHLPKITFNISGINLYHSGQDYGRVLNGSAVPDQFPIEPYGELPYFSYNYDFATDEPLYHSAQSVDLIANAEILPNFRLTADLIAEHRGSSYGVYATHSMIVYPRIDFKIDTAATLFGERFELHDVVGHFVNLRELEGLLMYNVDGKGTQASIGWHDLQLNIYKMGDMVNGIGLNTNDANDITLSMNDVHLSNHLRARVEGGWFLYDNVYRKQYWDELRLVDTVVRGDSETIIKSHSFDLPFVMANTGWTIAANVRADSLKVYGEYRYRNPLSATGSIQVKSALLAGMSDRYESNKFSFEARAEYRYYGALFNDNYINQNVFYRSGGYGLTIGDYLYPLTQFFRPFSQWAVFTEYQGRNVYGFSLFANSKYFFYDRFAVNAMLDLNVIKAGAFSYPFLPSYFVVQDPALPATIYPFYNVGLSWEPVKNTGLFASATNREMNIDKHYPTLYLLAHPALQLEVRFNFDQSKY